MIKLNIQRFGHTNSTTNYELPQFIGTDKPQWLTDINQAFLAIDTNLYSASSSATLANTSIGTLSDLTTTAKTDLVSAINEVDSDLGTLSTTVANHTTAIGDNTTAIGTLANLTTTAKTDLVSAVNEVDLVASNNATSIGNIANLETVDKTNVVSAVNEIVENFNINHFDSYTVNEISSTGQVNNITGTLYVATNEDGSIFKVYSDGLLVTLSGYGASSISVQTRIRPTSNLTIVGAGTLVDENNVRGFVWIRGASFSVNTNGVLTISLQKDIADGDNKLYILNPCIYFAKDFGDVPAPTP